MDILNTVKNLGFTEYEAKAYLALLSDAPATGYAVAKSSGVPRSKIYEVLENLTARGDVIISPGEPPMYRPLSAKELIALRKTKAEKNFTEAEKCLEQYEKSADDREGIWNIAGRDAILQKVNECISTAQKRILIEIWAEDFVAVEAALKAAAKRGVRIYVIAYGEIVADFAEVYPHDMSEEITAEYGGRWVVFSADDSQVLAGIVSLAEKSRAAWTKHQGLIMPITEVMIHDLYIAEILKTHRDVLESAFGKNLKELRGKFSISSDQKKHYI